jgi:hypothetical protein
MDGVKMVRIQGKTVTLPFGQTWKGIRNYE